MLNEIKRPSLDVTLEIEIPEIQPIKHDLDKVEVFVNKLDEFYREAINESISNFDLDIKLVKAERTKVRKVLKTIEDNRKAMVKAFKEPIKDFEETSKRIEKVLKGTDGFMKELVDVDKAAIEEDTTKLCYFKVGCDESQKDLLINFAKENKMEIKEEK